MDYAARVVAAEGGVRLTGAGDVAVAEVVSAGGPIQVAAGGAIGAVREDSKDPALNFSTPSRLSLSAKTGIGGLGVALLRMDAAEVEAVNGDLGDVMVAARSGLKAAGQGIRNDAPGAWTALLAETGRVDPGQIQSRSGQIVILMGRTTISSSDLVMRPSTLETATTVPGVQATLPTVQSVVQDTADVLQMGLEAVSRGLLTGSGRLSLTAVMTAETGAVQTLFAALTSASGVQPPSVSTQLAPVSESGTASGSASVARDRMVRQSSADGANQAQPSTSSTVAPASAAPSPGPAGAAPTDPVAAPASGDSGSAASPAGTESAAPAPAPADAPAAPASGEQPVDGATSESAPAPGSDAGKSPSSDATSSEGDGSQATSSEGEALRVELPGGARGRWMAVYAGLAERIGRWLDRTAPPADAAPTRDPLEMSDPQSPTAPGAQEEPTLAGAHPVEKTASRAGSGDASSGRSA